MNSGLFLDMHPFNRETKMEEPSPPNKNEMSF